MTSPATRLALGTAQFGLSYGATNARGQVSADAVARILEGAKAAGVGLLDTAPAYGESEVVLGRLNDIAKHFRIVTKTPRPGTGPDDIAAIRAAIAQSRIQLCRQRLDVLLVHHGQALLAPGGDGLLALLEDTKARGEASAIGVSVYDPAELSGILGRFKPDVVQLPFNVLDQRFAQSGLLDRLAGLGVEVHARSLYLQGTLIAGSAALPANLGHLRPAIVRFEARCKELGVTALEACIGFGIATPQLAKLVVGVTTTGELDELIGAAARGQLTPGFARDLAVDDPAIVNPSLWPKASQ